MSNRSLQRGLLWFLFCVAAANSQAQVLINEIHYRPANESVAEEFIELWNFGGEPIDLNGWQLSAGVRFAFSQITLPPDSGLVVAANAARFAELHPGVKNITGDWQGQLANNGETIRLVDATGATVDKVHYATEGDWARRVRGSLHGGHRGWVWQAAHDGGGHSLELMKPDLSNNNGQNWRTSMTQRGTPGRANSSKLANLPPMILDVAHSPAVPRSTEPVTITARLIDELPDEISAQLVYRLDGEAGYLELPMSRTAAEQFVATLPPQADGQVVEFFVNATDGQGAVRAWPSAPADCPLLLYQVDNQIPAPGRPLHRLILTELERKELTEIGRRPWYNSSDAQMSGTFINIEGGRTRVRYNVSVRLRGTTSRAATHKSRSVNFPNDRPWRNRTTINLNAIHPHVQELGSALFRLAGLPAPRARSVRVFENNEQLGGSNQFGHYAELDPLNSEYIRWQFPNDDNGNLYKGGGYADLKFLGDKPAPYAEKHFYAKQTNSWQNDYSDLTEFLRSLDKADESALADWMDVDAWMRHLAVHDLLGNEETSLVTGDKGDYSLYAGTTDSRFALIPYDLDAVLGVQGWGESPLWRAAANSALGQLMNRPTVAVRYWFHLENLARTVFSAEQLEPLIDQFVGDYLPTTEVNRLKSFGANRREFVLSQIPRELTVATGLAKRDGFFFSESATATLSGQAPATVTVAVEVNGQAADWFAPEARWQAKATLRRGLNRLLVRALDADGNEVARQHADVWHGTAPSQSLGQRLTQSTRWTAERPLLVTAPLLVPAGVTLAVNPGVTICFGPEGRLIVEGRLLAEGDPLRRIQFLRKPGSKRDWDGISFSNSHNVNRLMYVDFHHTSSYALAVTNSVVALDHVQWHSTRTNLIWFQDSSLTVRNCIFPELSHSEHIRGSGIRKDGELLIVNNKFNKTTGGADVIDVSGGKRPSAILEIYDNQFLGGNDDGLDLDGMDAHIEGNDFSGFSSNNRVGFFSAAIATGKPALKFGVWLNMTVKGIDEIVESFRFRIDRKGEFYEPNLKKEIALPNNAIKNLSNHLVKEYQERFGKTVEVNLETDESNITVVRNFFYQNDHHILLKDSARLIASNNSFFSSRFGGVAFNEPTDGLGNRKQPVGTPTGARLEGNIFFDNPNDLIHLKPLWLEKRRVWLHVFDSIIRKTHDWYGEGNLTSNPLFIHPPDDFTLHLDSPAIGNGPNGIDMGAIVPSGASISGEPFAQTRQTTAELFVAGPGITHYRYNINKGALSSEHPISEPIRLTKLASGKYTVYVIGKNSAGRWQALDQATQSKTWNVDSELSQFLINEVLAFPKDNESDQVELFNNSLKPLDAGGYHLTDNLHKPRKYVFPDNTVIGPDSFFVLVGGKGGLGFKLNSKGEGLWLFSPEGQLLDSIKFGQQLQGRSIGRVGRLRSWALARPTFGTQNQAIALGQPESVRLAEWTANAARDEVDSILLQNLSLFPVDLTGMRLSNNPIGSPLAFTFPILSFLDSNSRLKLDSKVLNFSLSDAQGEIGLSDANGDWLEHHVYGPQTNGQSLVLIPANKPTVHRFRLRVEWLDSWTIRITWKPETGNLFRVLSSKNILADQWKEEATLIPPLNRVMSFQAKLDGAMKYFRVEQSD